MAEQEDDLFGDAHALEERHIASGFEEGKRDGLSAGLLEGRGLGIQKGFHIGAEVGYYAAHVRVWRQAMQAAAAGGAWGAGASPRVAGLPTTSEAAGAADADASTSPAAPAATPQPPPSIVVPPRAARGVLVMAELLAQYPLYDPHDERLHDLLEALRSRFKAVSAAMVTAAAAGSGGGGGGGGGGVAAALAAAGGDSAALSSSSAAAPSPRRPADVATALGDLTF